MQLKAKKRDAKISLDALRKNGEMPAVFYGAKMENTPISVSLTEFNKVWHSAGESSTIKVALPEGEVDALIHEVQTDPVTDRPIHADFLAIDMNKKIRVKVELAFEGISEAVKTGIGILVKVMHELEIEALPKDLPHSLSVDISKLTTIQDQIFVSDIKLPSGVVAINNSTDVVASIAEQKEEVVEEAPPVDLSAIEVSVEKGKKEEEGALGATETPAEAPKKEEKK